MSEGQFFKTAYDRAACDVGVVHVGFGAFHRAHQAVYLDDYMQETGDLVWGIAAVNLRPQDTESFAASAAAKNGYLLKSIAPDGTCEFRAVRSHLAFFDATQDMNAALDLVSRDSVKIISLTVTESGYSYKDDWTLNTHAAPIAAELSGGLITTVYGYLAGALARRKDSSGAPVTVLCCDNIRSNGKRLRAALLSYLAAGGQQELADWVSANVTFPCSMVDRITPRSTAELHREIAQMFPAHAVAPVHAEDFSQWVIEDNFAADAPDLERVGVQVVRDVEPFEEAKIRILNGGHTALAYLGALAGHHTFDQAMRDPSIRPYFDRFEQDEVLPGLGDGIPFDTHAYLGEIAARFENAGIADQLERICMDGFSKMAIYIRPTLRASLARGHSPKASYACVASWVVYARKFKTGDMPISYIEPFWDTLVPLLEPGNETALATDTNLWGTLPTEFNAFSTDLVAAIKDMDKKWQA